jgi:hypothetical protein
MDNDSHALAALRRRPPGAIDYQNTLLIDIIERLLPQGLEARQRCGSAASSAAAPRCKAQRQRSGDGQLGSAAAARRHQRQQRDRKRDGSAAAASSLAARRQRGVISGSTAVGSVAAAQWQRAGGDQLGSAAAAQRHQRQHCGGKRGGSVATAAAAARQQRGGDVGEQRVGSATAVGMTMAAAATCDLSVAAEGRVLMTPGGRGPRAGVGQGPCAPEVECHVPPIVSGPVEGKRDESGRVEEEDAFMSPQRRQRDGGRQGSRYINSIVYLLLSPLLISC